MNNELKINGLIKLNGMEFHNIEGGFGENKKSILVKDIAIIHNRELKKINELINNNRKRFTDKKDIIDFLSPSERLRDFAKENGLIGSNRTQNVYLLSERGYAKLLKIMDDDLAWEKYDELVDGYFNMRQAIKSISEEQMLQLAIFNADSKENAILASAELDRYRKKQLKEKDELIEIQKPKADYTDMVLKSNKLMTITQIAKDYGMSGQAFNSLLHDLGIQYKQSGQWFLYSKYDNLQWVHSETYIKGNSTYINTKWTQKGRMGLYKLLKENNIIPTIEKLNEDMIA